MKIYILRHGQTISNKKKLLQGRSNAPLNEEGASQAEQVGEYFQKKGIVFDLVYSSPLVRAEETARIIVGRDKEIIKDDRLLEMDYGPYEGTSLQAPAPEIVYFFRDFVHHPAPEGMESLSSVVERMGHFLESIKDKKVENVLLATHAIAMKGALEYLTPDSQGAYWSKFLGNCALYFTEVSQGIFSIPKELNIRESEELSQS